MEPITRDDAGIVALSAIAALEKLLVQSGAIAPGALAEILRETATLSEENPATSDSITATESGLRTFASALSEEP